MQPTSRFAPLRSAVRRNVKVFAAISFSIGSMAPAISKIPAAELHVSKPVWWLESRWVFLSCVPQACCLDLLFPGGSAPLLSRQQP